MSAIVFTPSALQANQSCACFAAKAAVRFILESQAVPNNGHCPLSLRDGAGSETTFAFSDFQDPVPRPLIKMPDGGSSHQFSVLNKATLVGHLVVQVHGIAVGLVREPPNTAAALRFCYRIHMIDQCASHAFSAQFRRCE